MNTTTKKYKFAIFFAIWAMLFLGHPLTTQAQTVNIPDDNLRTALEEALGKTSGDTITVDDIATLEKFVPFNKGITDLTGLEFATGLTRLELNNNSVSDISPIKGLTRLSILSLHANKVSDISPIKDLVNLEILHLAQNLISDLSPLENLINLRGLNISHNAIIDLSPLAGLTKLNWIGLSGNPPVDLEPLSGLINLTRFSTWGTKLSNIAALGKLTKLQVIDICGGDVGDLSPLSELTSLRELYIVSDTVSDLSPLAELTNLTRLGFEGNNISDITPLLGLPNLKWVDLSHNSITEIGLIEELSENVIVIFHDNPVFPTGGPKIEGPWLWVIVPGKSVGAGDLLSDATDGLVTEEKIATVGAAEGKPVGDNVWIVDKIAASGRDNIGEMVRINSLGTGVVYGSTTLESPRQQETRMFVGHRDGAEVWLNGELVYQKSTGHWGLGYHVFFPVTLKAGTNVLLVALDNHHPEEWQGHFGFDVGTEYTVNEPISRDLSEIPAYDVNEDGQISILDLILIGQDFGKAEPANPRTDVNGDGQVNITDLVIVAQRIGEITGIPSAPAIIALRNSDIDSGTVKTWIKQAHAKNDGSLAFQDGIAYLQSLLTLFVPEKTALLANYPNPFNPETWIPYQLSADTDVRISIYATDGALIRTLDLGHQSVGIYQNRSRAAYWDGKNGAGELVSSGIYFYTLTAGDFIATRKMLILK